jgi:hypothetical protein
VLGPEPEPDMDKAIKTVRRIVTGGGTQFDAIRYLRSLGLSFKTARNMAEEIMGGARWYRPSLYR